MHSKKHLNNSFAYLLIYIDSLQKHMLDQQFKRQFKRSGGDFKMKDLDSTKKILGIKLRKGGSVGLRRYLSI